MVGLVRLMARIWPVVQRAIVELVAALQGAATTERSFEGFGGAGVAVQRDQGGFYARSISSRAVAGSPMGHSSRSFAGSRWDGYHTSGGGSGKDYERRRRALTEPSIESERF
jgi:hypothetical protein